MSTFSRHSQTTAGENQMDEREVFLGWLISEFGAANAIIDEFCDHLQAVGEPGEYDSVRWSLERRRYYWNPILYPQHYIPVAEVVSALQQVGRRRQQQQNAVGSARRGGGGNNFRRGGGFDVQISGGEVIAKLRTKDEGDKAKVEEKEENIGSCRVDGSELTRDEKQNLQVSPKTFVANDICGEKLVNIAEGLKLYENLFDDSEISKLINLVKGLRLSGWRRQLQGQTFVTSDIPMNGHGREMIQFGVPIADGCLEDEAARGTSKDLEPIPDLLQNVIERLLTEKVVSIKPDSTIIDFFHEGDCSQPHIWPQWFGRPVCVLFLTECKMSFGWVVEVDTPGGCHRGALKLSLSPGSMLVMQGRSANFSRHAIPSLWKKRILVTFVKSQPKKINTNNIRPFPSIPARSSNWAPSPSRPSSHVRTLAPFHFYPIPPTGVLPGNAFPATVSLQTAFAGWPVGAPPIHLPPRLPTVPGAGVFLPSQSSGNSPNLPVSTLSTENITMEPPAESSEENVARKPNDHHTLPEAEVQAPDANTDGGTVITNEEEHENHDSDK